MNRATIRNQFLDVAEVLESVLSSSGGTYRTETKGQAVAFRHRCYTFMKKYREAEAFSPSPYDKITIRAIHPDDPLSVRMEIRKAKGSFTPDNEAPVEASDPTLDAALAVRKSLGLD